MTLTQAHARLKETGHGVSVNTIKSWAIAGRHGLRFIRDPVGRMLLYRVDIERVANADDLVPA